FDLSTRAYEISSFECRDCANGCEIRKVTVDGGAPFFYGSRCGKFEEKKAPNENALKWPDLFEYRSNLAFNPPEVQEIIQQTNALKGKTIGLMRTMFFAETGPFWAVFWASLGFEPVWSSPTNKSIIHRGCEKVGSEFCFPIKAAHGHILDLIDKNLDYIFIPSIVNLFSAPQTPENAAAPDNAACPYVQSLAYLAPAALNIDKSRYITGPVFFGEGDLVLENSLTDLVGTLGISRGKVKMAMAAALKAQQKFAARLMEKGRQMLDELGPDDKALVVVARPYNGFDPGLNLRLNHKLADLGVMGLPMDFLPLDTAQNQESAAHYWRYGQKITAAANMIALDPRLEALYISNFGCGPDSFINHFFKHQLAGKPFLEIEIDEHSSDVGAVTRLEAFLDSLAARQARGKTEAAPTTAAPILVSRVPQLGKTIYLPPMCDHVITAAATFRSVGINAIALPPSDRETIELGRAQTSGKECYPLILTVGDFIKLTRRPDFDPAQSSIFMPYSNGPCRFGQYSRYLKLVMARLGYSNLDVLSLDQTGGMYTALDAVGQGAKSKGRQSFSRNFWRSLVATDLLQKALYHTRPREASQGAADTAYQAALADLVYVVENNGDLEQALKKARHRFELALDKSAPYAPKPKVGLVGEIYVRHNSFANEDIIKRLEALGGEVLCPPFAEWIFYVGFVNTMRAKRRGHFKPRLKNFFINFFQMRDFEKLAGPWDGFFPDGAVDPPISSVIKLGEKFLHRSFQGEAILSLGKGVEYFHHQAAGLINIMPFTCMPGMVVEGLIPDFRQSCQDMPTLNLSFDGQSQTNTQARLEAFMYQVKDFQARHLKA
ncbi:MAG: acyl-CoA dehydratase activase-related protein, partial [Candidatus Adiutrix sp.]